MKLYFSPEDKKRAAHHAQELGLSSSAYFRMLDSAFVLANRGTRASELRGNIAKGKGDVLLVDAQTLLAVNKDLLAIRAELREFHEAIEKFHETAKGNEYFDAAGMAEEIAEVGGSLEKTRETLGELETLFGLLLRECNASNKSLLKLTGFERR